MTRQIQRLVLLLLVAALHSGSARADEEVAAKTREAPARAHVITWRFDGLPAPVQDITLTAEYEVENRDCVPLDHSRAIGGVRLSPRHSLTATVERTGNGAYIATVFEDALQDEDYFRLGVCRWKLETATIRFASPHATQFVGGISGDQLREGAAVTQSYLLSDFGKAPTAQNAVFGEDPGFFPADKPQFALKITVRGWQR